MYPSDRRYTKDHEVDPRDGQPRTRRASPTSHRSSSATWCLWSFPRWVARFHQGQTAGTIESVKAVSELQPGYVGKVVAVNPDVTSKPELVEQRPHAPGSTT